ncbi:uncharacterized protein LOC101891809 [Musca domestica]|uniref:Uncharacterized protein LOC101891809 n=1 Tax=Musca domestica TaxID=7370 RepID=A0A9J7I2I5_MUSDO|nr:uncharacterized protein LOC101891809 [Musca domestica]
MNVRKLIIAILGLSCFPSPSLPWNDTFIANFILKLYPVLKAQGNIWFLSQLMTTQHTEHLDRFIKRIQDGSGEAQYVWNNRSDVRIIRTASKRNSVAFVLTTGPDDPVMHVHSRVMTGRHFYFSVFIYVPKVHDFREIERLAHLLYLGSFANSMVYYQQPNGQNELAGTEQFPHFQMINLTDFTVYVRRQFQKVMSANQDVAGYKFYTPLRQDLPHVIKYHDKMGRLQLQGTTFRILEDFIDSLNGSIAEYEMPRDNYGYEVVNMKEVLDLVRSRKIDLAAHAYALYHTDDDLDKSYPIMVVKWCLMVPLQNSISTFLYILQPFGWKVWCILLLVFSGLLSLDFLRIFLDSLIFKELRRKFPSQLSDAWLEDFCHIICITAPKAIQVATLKRFLYYATLFFFSFFLSANYTSYLGSFLTVSLFRAQINTMEDLIQAQLPVMIIDYELEFLLSEGFHMPEEFGKLIRSVDSHTFVAHQIQFNKSFAYFVTDDTWHFLDEAQKHLKQKVFKFSDICFGSYHLAYPIQMDSAVWRDLEYFLFRTHSNGLLQKYEHETFQYAVAAGFIKRLAETQEHSSAGLEHLRLLFIIWGLLCGMGLFCLLIEICIYKYRHYKLLKL